MDPFYYLKVRDTSSSTLDKSKKQFDNIALCNTFIIMSNNAVVHARIDSSIKKDAESVFSSLGMTPTEAVRLFYTQVSLHKAIPFQLHIPNDLTKKPLDESANGVGVNTYDSIDAMFSSWDD